MGEGARSHRLFWMMAGGFWLQPPLAEVPGHLRGQSGGGRGTLLSAACASCPSIGSQHISPPAHRCQSRRAKAPGAAKPAGSLLESQRPDRPAHLLLAASCMPVGGGSAAYPSGQGASHWVLRASWQAGGTGQHINLPASAR